METIQQQLNAFQTSVKRQRLLNIALLAVIIVGSSVAATVAATSTRKAVQISMIDRSPGTPIISVIDDEGFVWLNFGREWSPFPQLPVIRIEPSTSKKP